MSDSGDYSAVPPPPALNTGNPNLNFSDALSKARAIAEKLKQNKESASPTIGSGQKRSYEDSYDRGYSRRDSRDDDYQHERENKRGAYDRSHSSYDSYGSRDKPRYGLGSDERKHSSYGPSASQHVKKEEFGVPNSIVGLVIGKGGENLKRIEAASGARIQFGQDEGDSERRCNITGEDDQVQVAKDMVMQVVNDASSTDSNRRGGGMPSAYGSGGNTVSVSVPGNKVGLVIGRGGETIRSLESQSGAKIAIAQENPGERSYERTINITGADDAVERAKALIDDIVNGGFGGDRGGYSQRGGYDDNQRGYGSGANAYGPPRGDRGGYGGPGGHRGGQPGDENDSVNVPQSSVGLIIGKGGETIRGLEQESGARIKVDQASSTAEERTILLYGQPDAIALAKQLIQDKIAGNRDGGGRYGGRGGYNNRGYDRSGYGGQSGYDSSSAGAGAGAGGGYDYSQYYGYYNQGSGEAGGEGKDASNYAGYYQYPYGNYSQYPPAASANADGSKVEGGAPQSTEDGQQSGSAEGQTSEQQAAAAAYYAQYYGQQGQGQGHGQGQDQGQDSQYYQYYQQYYSQYPGYDANASATDTAAGTNSAEAPANTSGPSEPQASPETKEE
ncbi:Far upstream element-binding protein 3 [Umbelopsis sp. WA50703]